ncbi:hypothetical protein DOTSEDRAFT_73460 [Dothistroma septosporum NZE10]|uniref:Uncharacterized protein n=1 Tax=Dothistroma septosporum (strain NZE10 / CBS 128990) TaxID=675120 RepID=N1PKJ9_DOTSN|nr:hypothetical protein DOTSEDRAFT_73460 [Dothistroma septosporum NZE10]
MTWSRAPSLTVRKLPLPSANWSASTKRVCHVSHDTSHTSVDSAPLASLRPWKVDQTERNVITSGQRAVYGEIVPDATWVHGLLKITVEFEDESQGLRSIFHNEDKTRSKLWQ